MTKLEGHSYMRYGSVTLAQMGNGWTLYCNNVDLMERHEMLAAYAVELAAEIERTGDKTQVLSVDIPGHPATIAREECARAAAEQEQRDAEFAAKLEAAARWQCEPCDRLFKSPEEFMAHECPPPLSPEMQRHVDEAHAWIRAQTIAAQAPKLADVLREARAQYFSQAPEVPIDPDITFRKVGSRDLYVCKVEGGMGACECCKPGAFFSEHSLPGSQIRCMSGHVELTQPIRSFLITGILPPDDVSDQAAKSIERWRDAGVDDDE